MDVRLPDGTLIQNIPDDMSRADLTEKLKANGYDVSGLTSTPAPAAKQPSEKAQHQAEGQIAAKQRMAASDEYNEVPVYDFNGAATGATERVLKPKADPVGMGAMSVFPFGEDIAMLGKGQVPFTDEYAAAKERLSGEMEATKEAYPKPYMLGQAGSLVGQGFGLAATPLPGAAWGTHALPEGASLGMRGAQMLQRAAGAGVGGATVGGITGLGEGTGMDRLKGAAIGTVVGGGLGALSVPLVEGAIGGAKLIYDKAGKPITELARGLMDPRQLAEEAAAKSLGSSRRMTANGPPEFDQMLNRGEPVMIGDVGGEPTKALARSAANTSPEARETLMEPIRDRFASQTERVGDEIKRMFPETDYTQTIEGLHQQARAANKPVYDQAYADGASGIFNDTLYDLAKAPTMQRAMRGADARAMDQPAYGSTKEGVIINPFTWDRSGNLVAKKGMQATDANLAYWDIVKRNLDSTIEKLDNAGQFSKSRDIKAQRASLISTLEEMVPSYKDARGTAQKFFNAEDAYEAGINLGQASSPRDVSELFNAWKGFTDPEKELFARGRAAYLLQKNNATRDGISVTNKDWMGDSPVERAKNLMALGPQRASTLEARLRSERIMDNMRTAVNGNSTTARQLAEYGLAGAAGSGAGYTQGDASLGGMAGIMLKAGHGQVSSGVQREIASILTSRDPALLAKLTAMADRSPAVSQAVREAQQFTPSGPLGSLAGNGTVGLTPTGMRSLAVGQIGADMAEPPQPRTLTIPNQNRRASP